MAKYITRVELHNATSIDYDQLHLAMIPEGFSRQITGDDGTTYDLPPAEYYRECFLSAAQVRESAGRAALTTRKAFAILVTEAGVIAWQGLNQTPSLQQMLQALMSQR